MLATGLDATTGQVLIQEIRIYTGYSLGKISQVTDIPMANLLRMANGVTRQPTSLTWNKLLYFYCHLTLKQ